MEYGDSEIRPLPSPPRCRGIPLGNGDYTGCAYGYGDIPPFTGPGDCPTCNGSGIEGGVVGTTMPHADFGAPDCCGCLNGIITATDCAEIVCNECEVVVRTVPPADLQQTLDEMELSLDMCTEMCPHCGKVNIFPGFSKLMVYTCKECGEAVELSNNPNIDDL